MRPAPAYLPALQAVQGLDESESSSISPPLQIVQVDAPAPAYFPFAHDAHAVAALFNPSSPQDSSTSAEYGEYVQAPAVLQLVVLAETSPVMSAAVQADSSVAAQALETGVTYDVYMQAPAALQLDVLAVTSPWISAAVHAAASTTVQDFTETPFVIVMTKTHSPAAPPAAASQSAWPVAASGSTLPHAAMAEAVHDSRTSRTTGVYVHAALPPAAASQVFRLTVASASTIRDESAQVASAVAPHTSATVAANGV